MKKKTKETTYIKDISETTKSKIIEYFKTNKNNSSPEISKKFGVSGNNVDAILNNYLKTKIHGFEKRF
jgi:predicted HTH transcriptional regulator